MKANYIIQYSAYDNYTKKQIRKIDCFYGTENQACDRAARCRARLREKNLWRIKVVLLQITDMQHIRTLK